LTVLITDVHVTLPRRAALPNQRQQRRRPVWPATHSVRDGACCCANMRAV